METPVDEKKDLVTPSTSERYIWCELPRVDPPKRKASERIADFQETYSLFDIETVKNQAARCVQCAMPFCTLGCPLSNRIPEWLGLAAEGRFQEAAAISRATSNMPEICSRVCPQEKLCEGMCTLTERTEPIPIGAIEKFINEYAFANFGNDAHRVMPNGLSAAVIGAGPAGMACADELAKLGYAVTVFESLDQPGGLLVYGIPSFKLEKSVVDRRIDILKAHGVVFRTGVKIGKDIGLEELLSQFDAVFLGMGAQKPKELDIPGGDLKGVYQSIPFLIEKNLGDQSGIPTIHVEDKAVVVLGGGDTAMDCLRTAVRCHARESICIYRRDFANMPGSRKEYKNATEEGAQFLFLANPIRLIGDAQGNVKEIECIQMELGEPDSKGRRKPIVVPGSEFIIPADVVLVAYGFDPVVYPPTSDLSKVKVNEWGGVIVDDFQMTSIPRVFSGGDLVRGANLVVYAVRDGRKAAAGIHRYMLAQKRIAH